MALQNIPDSPPLATANAPGAMKGNVGDSFVPTTITSGLSGATLGDLYTTTSGVAALAKGDTIQHIGNVLQVFDGSTLAVLVGMGSVRINFDSAPVVDQPCYLSPTTAGKATTTLPDIAFPAPIWIGVVKQDLSVGAAYAARVDCTRMVQIPSPGGTSRSARITQDMLAQLGGNESDYLILEDDFNKQYVANPKIPSWGVAEYVTAMGDPTQSAITFICDGANETKVRQNGVITNATTIAQQRFYMAIRGKVSQGGFNAKFAAIKMNTDGTYVGFGTWPTANQNGDDTKYFFWHGTHLSGFTAAGTLDANYHWFYCKSPGDGTVSWKMDNGAWNLVNMADGTGTVDLFMGYIYTSGAGKSLSLDYIMLATPRA